MLPWFIFVMLLGSANEGVCQSRSSIVDECMATNMPRHCLRDGMRRRHNRRWVVYGKVETEFNLEHR